MRVYLSLVALSLLASPAAAAEWRQAREYELRLSSYDIQPSTIRLKAGEPVRLRLVNNSTVGYRLSAGDFFASSQLRRRDGRAVDGGSIAVGAGETREIALVPAPGRYRLKSRNFLHRILGMHGQIIVE